MIGRLKKTEFAQFFRDSRLLRLSLVFLVVIALTATFNIGYNMGVDVGIGMNASQVDLERAY